MCEVAVHDREKGASAWGAGLAGGRDRCMGGGACRWEGPVHGGWGLQVVGAANREGGSTDRCGSSPSFYNI